MTMKIANEIKSANIAEISGNFAKQGISTDFQGNKVIAWCCQKTLGIFNELNRKYGLKLGLPKAIYVNDFSQLKCPDEIDGHAFHLFLPCKIKPGSEQIFSERTLFFNRDSYAWKNINEFADVRFKNSNAASNNFLDVFTHEFSHPAHVVNLRRKQNAETYTQFIYDALKERNKQKLSTICDYAAKNPIEAIGCDLSRTVIDSLNSNLVPIKNSFANSPYEKLSVWDRLFGADEDELNQLLRDFWNGKLGT